MSRHDWRQRQMHHRALRDRQAAGPHDPSNAKQQELAEESFETEETRELREVYVVVLKTKGQDTRLGPVFFDRGSADVAVEEFLSNNSYANAWWVLRHAEVDDGAVS